MVVLYNEINVQGRLELNLLGKSIKALRFCEISKLLKKGRVFAPSSAKFEFLTKLFFLIVNRI